MDSMNAENDTQRLNWLLAQLGVSRDELDWAIDQDGSYDPEMGLWPERSSAWNPVMSAMVRERKRLAQPMREAYGEFIGDLIFPVVPLKPQPAEVHFRKVTA